MEFPPAFLRSAPALEAVRIIERLRENGFVAVMAGGCVRDALLGHTPKDFDVATDATPDSVQRVFGKRRTIAFGASFGVIGVLPPVPSGVEGNLLTPTEVATFRADGAYSDGRRPDHVTYGTAEADAARRDFTINGLFYDPASGEILDYVDGLSDLRSMHLRTIGSADRRFEEDKLRMLRAVRFFTTLGLSIEESTLRAICQHADTLGVVSGERIGAEMRRVLSQADAVRGLRLLVDTGLHRQVWPQLQAVDWSRLQTCWNRLSLRSFESGLATVLMVLHPETSAAMEDLRSLTLRWKLSAAEQRAITSAIQRSPQVMACEAIAWSRLQPILIDRDVDVIVAVAHALAQRDEGVARAQAELQREPGSLDPPQLLNGQDLIAMGLTPGQNFRTWLAEIRRLQLDDVLVTRDDAVAWLREQT